MRVWGKIAASVVIGLLFWWFFATACFALSLYDRRPPHSPRAFLYDAFTASGGFSAGPGDDVADLEYTTYGLLTMGVL